LKTEIADFFVNYKLEPMKWVKVKEWKDVNAAEKTMLAAFQQHKEESYTT
jgi:inorganic pyrophosphatase